MLPFRERERERERDFWDIFIFIFELLLELRNNYYTPFHKE